MYRMIALVCVVAMTLGVAQADNHVTECPDPNGNPNYCDSDGDGLDDNSDNCTLVPNPDQKDADDDGMGNYCDADFNNDGNINFLDLDIMKAAFLQAGDLLTDLDGNGITNFLDLQMMAAMFFSEPGPGLEAIPCDCYFSGDCSGGFCDYGPGSFATEDICVWRGEKPNGVDGFGCSFEVDAGSADWPPGVCDGVCTRANEGSTFGFEDQALVAQAIELWGDAMMVPSAAGGGPVDAEIAAQAMALQFEGTNVSIMLGRHTADALALSAGDSFHDYFCHWEGHPDDDHPPTVNLADDQCRIQAGQITVRALASEIRNPGTAAGIMAGIASICPDYYAMFQPLCSVGPGAIKCAVQRIEDQAYFLRTPRIVPAAEYDPARQILGSAE